MNCFHISLRLWLYLCSLYNILAMNKNWNDKHTRNDKFEVDLWTLSSMYYDLNQTNVISIDCILRNWQSIIYQSVCLYVFISVFLSRFYGLYRHYNGLDFDQNLWKCWNLGSIDCIKFHKINLVMTSFWRRSWFFSFVFLFIFF